jgi:hypothetical protein
MEVMCSSETSVHMRITRRYTPEDGFNRIYHCDNLKSYTENVQVGTVDFPAKISRIQVKLNATFVHLIDGIV